jgi:hypothetical protein
MRLVRDRAVRVHRLVDLWHAGEDVKVNKPYVDLVFAFGLAKLGESTAARDLLRQARDRLLEPAGPKGGPDPAREFLWKAFAYRIENALQGKPHTGPLSPDLLAALENIDENRGTTIGWRYIVDRLRQSSWILEPQERTVAYARWLRHGDDLRKGLAELANLTDPRRLEEAVKRHVRANTSPDSRLVVFSEVVPLAPRVGEDFAVALVQQVPAVLDAVDKWHAPREHLASLAEPERRLLERSLFLAAHYDRAELVQTIFARFLEYLRTRSEEDRHAAINDLARVCLRSLRKLGLKDDTDRFLRQTSDLIVQGKSLAQLRQQSGPKWPDVLASLLALAEGWLYFGGQAQARPFLDEALDTIAGSGQGHRDKISPLPFTKVVTAYVSALGQGPVDLALNRIVELFQKMGPIPNTFTTASYYSRLHLAIVEEVVRSLVSDNMALGDQARRWLDDDEFLVRRRIHADMRKVLASHGL